MKKTTALLGLAAVGSLCTPAFAGHWDRHYDCVGVTSVRTIPEINGYNTTPWVTPADGDTIGNDVFADSLDMGQHVSYNHGTYQAVFTWVPDGPGDAPPNNLTVRESFTTEASTNLDPTSGIVLEMSYGDFPAVYYTHSDENIKTASGKYVNTWIVPSDGVLKLPVRTFHTLAGFPEQAADPYVYEGSMARAKIDYGAVIETRVVQLTRGIPALQQAVNDNGVLKTKDGVVIHPERDEWIDTAGVGHGHTLASYHERPVIGLDTEYSVTNTVNAVKSGGWSAQPALTYKWEPKMVDVNAPNPHDVLGALENGRTLAETEDYQIRETLFSNAINFSADTSGAYGWINHPSNKTGTVANFQYELTDHLDDTKAISKYELTLHDEWEDPIPDPLFVRHVAGNQPDIIGESKSDWYYVTLGVPGVPISPETHPDRTWSFTVNSKFDVKLQASFSSSFKVQDWANFGGSATVNAEGSVSTQNNIEAWRPMDIYPGAPTGSTYQQTLIYYNRKVHKLFNRYNANGAWLCPDTMYYDRSDIRYGRWPQSKEEEPMVFHASWLIIPANSSPAPVGVIGFWSNNVN